MLIEKGADVNKANNDGKAPLLIALENGHVDVAQALIAYGTSTEYISSFLFFKTKKSYLKDSKYASKLMQFVKKDMLLYLVKRGEISQAVLRLMEYYDTVDLSSKDDNSKNVFHYIAKNCYDETLVPKFFANILWHKQGGVGIDDIDEEGNTPLHCALMSNNEVAVKALIDAGADISKDTIEGKSIFEVASTSTSGENIKKLIASLVSYEGDLSELRKNINDVDKKGLTALHKAVLSDVEAIKKEEVLKYLLNKRVDRKAKDIYGNTAAFYAIVRDESNILLLMEEREKEELKEVMRWSISMGSAKCVKSLHYKGVGIEEEFELVRGEDKIRGNTGLHVAARWGYEELVSFYIEKRGYIERENEEGELAIHLAARGGHVVVLERLLIGARNENNIDIVNNKSKYGRTPLHKAAYGRHVEATRILGRYGADSDERDDDGNRPIDIVMLKRTDMKIPREVSEKRGILEALLEAREIKEKGELSVGGDTRIDLAAKYKEQKAVEFFVECGFINDIDEEGNTVLHYASINNDKNMVVYLLENGSNPEIKNEKGDTALHVSGGIEVAEELLDSKRNSSLSIDVLGSSGQTALHAAVRRGNKSLVSFLLREGSNYLAIGDSEQTVKGLASKIGNIEIIEAIEEAIKDPLYKQKLKGKKPAVKEIKEETEAEKRDKVLREAREAYEARDWGRRFEGGKTQLHIAVENDDVGLIEMAVKEENRDKIDFNAKDEEGGTALHIAIRGYKREIFNILLPLTDLEIENKENETVFHIASRIIGSYYLDKLIDLAERVAPKIEVSKMKINPLSIAVEEMNIENAKRLLEYDKRLISKKDKLGITPLIIAARMGNLSMVKMLVKLGAANINDKDNGGISAIYIAAKEGHEEIVEELLALNAKHLRNKDIRNKQLLSIAESAIKMAIGAGEKTMYKELGTVPNVSGNLPTMKKMGEDTKRIIRKIEEIRDRGRWLLIRDIVLLSDIEDYEEMIGRMKEQSVEEFCNTEGKISIALKAAKRQIKKSLEMRKESLTVKGTRELVKDEEFVDKKAKEGYEKILKEREDESKEILNKYNKIYLESKQTLGQIFEQVKKANDVSIEEKQNIRDIYKKLLEAREELEVSIGELVTVSRSGHKILDETLV